MPDTGTGLRSPTADRLPLGPNAAPAPSLSAASPSPTPVQGQTPASPSTATPAGAAAAQALWADALTALQLLARQPHRLGGAWLRAPHGPVREAWLQALSALALPVLRAPGSVDTPRWLGGLDLSATLQSGRVHEQAGLLRQADGGLLCLPMAERFAPTLTATLAQTLDRGGVDRGGRFEASRFGVVALDESLDDEAPLAPALQERLGLWLDLREVPPAVVRKADASQAAIARREPSTPQSAIPRREPSTPQSVIARSAATKQTMDGRARLAMTADGSTPSPLANAPSPVASAPSPVASATLPPVSAGDSVLQALCGTALALGIDSLRVPQLALAVACAHADLHGRDHVADEDLAYACRTVLAPRARQWPAAAGEVQRKRRPRTPAQTQPSPPRQSVTTPRNRRQTLRRPLNRPQATRPPPKPAPPPTPSRWSS